MDKELGQIGIFDGSYFLHRALHTKDVFNLKNSKGQRAGGVYQVLRMISKELKVLGEYSPIVVFDSGLSARRTALDKDYKRAEERAKQDEMVLTPEEADSDYVTQYRKQRNMLCVLLPLFGIPAVKFAGWEGDDLMYILTRLSDRSLILSDDRDMLQLLSDKTRVRRPMMDELWDLPSFLADMKFDDISEFVSYKAVLGDNSDNIPSCCKGVGKDTAGNMVKIIRAGDIEGFGVPDTEEDMRQLCEKYNVKYRKAFLNFDEKRYNINLQLVDLGLVKIHPNQLNSIYATIDNAGSQIDYFNAIKYLSDLEIQDFAIDELMMLVKSKRHYLWR